MEKRLSKVVCLYLRKCFKGGAFVDGKFNFRAYNYVAGIMIDNLKKHDLSVIYQYLLDYEKKDYPSIFRILSEAQKFNQTVKAQSEKEKVKAMNIKKYEDFSVEELLR